MSRPALPAPPVETFDVFEVEQITRGTRLESIVAVDRVRVGPGRSSQSHRHNRSETVLWIVEGSGTVRVGDRRIEARPGDRIAIGPGVVHGVETGEGALVFLSVQAPPILDEATGVLDLEPAEA